jgi:hypothetical protein
MEGSGNRVQGTRLGTVPFLFSLPKSNREAMIEMGKLIHQSKMYLKRNSSTILTCAGAVGVVATTVTAVKATPKALTLLEEAKKEKGEELTKMEVVQVAGPVYIPTALIGAATIACMFGANILNNRHQASITSAYALLDQSYKEYKAKTIELYGEEADGRIREEIAKDNAKGQDLAKDDKQLFYDEFSGRYFSSTMEEVIKAEYELNKRLSLYSGVYLNEFYELLDIPPMDYGEHLGWSSGQLMDYIWSDWLDFEHKKVVLDDGLECFIIAFNVDPMFDFEYY